MADKTDGQTYYTQILNIGGDYFIYLHMLRKIINKNYVSLRCIYCSYNCSHDQIPEQSSSSVVVTVTNLTTGISLLWSPSLTIKGKLLQSSFALCPESAMKYIYTKKFKMLAFFGDFWQI